MLSVNISIPSGMYLDYLKYLFPADPTGCLLVSSSSDFGRLAIAFARVSDTPRPIPLLNKGEEAVTLILPEIDAARGLKDRWLYYSSGDNARLILALKALFNIDLKSYWLKGEQLGIDKKDIVDAFIVSRKLTSTEPYEALHKRLYRSDLKRLSAMRGKLLRKVRYFGESIDASGLD